MKRALPSLSFVSLFIVAACGPADPNPTTAAAVPAASSDAPGASVAPMPSAAPVASAEPAKAPELTAEEKKKAEQQRKTEEFHAKVEADAKVEAARWTPELHAEAKKLAEKKYATAKAGIQAAMAGHHRKPGSAERDKYRHPVETLDFFGLKPTMTVLEYGPGEGWYTELLAPTLAVQGKLLVTSSNPAGPADQRSTYYGLMLKLFLEKAPELFAKVQALLVDNTVAPTLGLEGKLDMIILTRELHGMQNSGKLGAWLAEFHRALKPGGIVGIEQHRAAKDAKAEESSKNGYLPEAWVIAQFEAAGFKLVASSEINANPKDTKDYPEGVWTLPPSYELKDKDHEKYAAIGESDRMTLKFVRVEMKAAKDAPKTK